MHTYWGTASVFMHAHIAKTSPNHVGSRAHYLRCSTRLPHKGHGSLAQRLRVRRAVTAPRASSRVDAPFARIATTKRALLGLSLTSILLVVSVKLWIILVGNGIFSPKLIQQSHLHRYSIFFRRLGSVVENTLIAGVSSAIHLLYDAVPQGNAQSVEWKVLVRSAWEGSAHSCRSLTCS